MGKSKHPTVLITYLKNIGTINKLIKSNNAALERYSKACVSAQKLADSTITKSGKQYKYLRDVIDKYARKVWEIQELEEQQQKAKGDKNKEATLKKKIAKADKEADAIRKEYELAMQRLSVTSALMTGEKNRVKAAGRKVIGF